MKKNNVDVEFICTMVIIFLSLVILVFGVTGAEIWYEKSTAEITRTDSDGIEEIYYVEICTAISESRIKDSNGNVWVADIELIPDSKYAVTFTDNGTPEYVSDDLIVVMGEIP